MKKISIIVLLLALLTLLLVGCESVADVEQIQTDLESYHDFLGENEKITALEITKRETEKKNNLDVVHCRVTTEDSLRSYEKKLVLTYTYDETDKWVLDHVSINSASEWNIAPVRGVNKEEIIKSLQGMSVTAGDEVWNIKSENIASVSILSQNTDLAGKKDVVTVNLTIDDVVQEATGQLELSYIFDGKWTVDSASGNGNFIAEAKTGTELDATDETLISAFADQTFAYGVEGVKTQKITATKSEISDFSIVSQESANKGTLVTYLCSCTLTKNNAVFALEIKIPFHYSNGWNLDPASITAKCTSVQIEGNWIGTNVYGRSCELNITGIDAVGNIEGTYTDHGDSNHKSYSYHVSGQIDLNTLLITLKAGDAIEKPSYSWWKPNDITAQLKVDKATIMGNADLQFTVSQ